MKTRDMQDGKPRVLVAAPVPLELMQRIESQYEVYPLWKEEYPNAWLAANGSGFRAVVTTGRVGANRSLIDNLPNLEIIASFSVGFDAIDLRAARAQSVVVTNTPGVLDDCVAETALGLMLAVSRRICEADRFVRAGQWEHENFGLGRKLAGQRCGIVGMGNIGQEIAKRAEAFGVTILYHNRKLRQDLPAHYRYYDDLVSLAHESDILVICVPGGPRTHHLVNAQVFAAMPSNAILINVARGSVVEEAALIAALETGQIAGAGLDVYEHEPMVSDALCGMDQVVLLPHIGSATYETRQAMAELVLKNLDCWFSNRQPVTPV